MTEPLSGIVREDAVAPKDAQPIASEQVARRMHEWRCALGQLAGLSYLPPWDELDPDEQELAIVIAYRFVRFLNRRADVPPEQVAHFIHNQLVTFNHDVPLWNKLDEEERELAIKLATELLAWLSQEGQL